MSKIETKASDSRQSVDLKWKLRKGLEENVAFKEDGTMEVGKNLEVDGNLVLNTAQNIKDRNGKNLLPIFQHTVTIVCPKSAKTANDGHKPLVFTFTAMSSKNTPIRSYNDLKAVFGGGRFGGSGQTSDTYLPMPESPVLFIDLHGGAITTDYFGVAVGGVLENPASPNVIELSNYPILLFSDDVCVLK